MMDRNTRLVTLGVTVALVALNLIALNYLLAGWSGARVDLTKDKIFSISPTTKRILGSLGEDVTIYGYFSERTHPKLAPLIPELVDLFTRLGLRTLGGLAALDPGDVLARFGAEGLHAHRLAGGADQRSTSATDPPPEWCVEHVFREPVEQLEAVVFVAKRLADELGERLAGEGRVCVRLVVIAETEHGERNERAWYRDHGFRDGDLYQHRPLGPHEHGVTIEDADANRSFEAPDEADRPTR